LENGKWRNAKNSGLKKSEITQYKLSEAIVKGQQNNAEDHKTSRFRQGPKGLHPILVWCVLELATQIEETVNGSETQQNTN
jgi:hypothetical protein